MRKFELRHARISAAVLAVLSGALSANARNLTWDSTGAIPPVDGSGNWDLSSTNWYDPGTNAVVTWSNANPDSAVFGTTTANANVAPYTVLVNDTLTVQNITFANATNGAFYNLSDAGNSNDSLTLDGNILKTATSGATVIQLTNPLNLSSGNHTVTLQDTSGNAPPEMTMQNPISGAGSLTLDNGLNSSGYPQWGTLVLNADSTYSGGTNIVKGRLVINTSNGLGGGQVNISSQGNLSIGGAGTVPLGNLTITNPIEITRNTYTGNDYGDYPDAVTSTNAGMPNSVMTFSGPFVVDSTNAQIAADTSTILISSNITQGPDVTNGMLTVDGDFAGYVTLSGNNTALTGGIQIIGGVELNVSSLANLGGATAPLTFSGSGTFHPVGGFITNFGTLNVNYSTFQGGIDVDQNQSFTINQNLGGAGNSGGSVGKRGLGTLNIGGTDILEGETFWDSGNVNVTGSVTLGSLHLRSPIVTISTGGSVTTNNGYDSFGNDTNGTNGGPDKATINLTGTGELIEASGDDFNVSDNPQTQGTINMSGNSVLSTGGVTYLGKSTGAVGTVNQSGGTFTINRQGNFGLDIADSRGGSPTGYYNLSGGIFSSPAGEIYVGEGGGGGTGYWTQTGGTATFGTWFVIGREGATGNLSLSGGTLTKVGTDSGSNFSIGEGSQNVCTMSVSGTGVFTEDAGQFWVGNGGVGVLNMGTAAGATTGADATASITVNDWFAVGRNGTGTVNLYDGTITQQTQSYFTIGSGGTGVVNVYGGNLNAFQAYIGETGGSSGTLNIYSGNVNLGPTVLANAASVTGSLNLDGGTLTGTQFTDGNGGGTGEGLFFFNGGTLKPSASNTNFIGAKVTSVVSTGGAKINTNAFAITVNSALTHDTTLSGKDGGLTVSGGGTLTVTAANTYTGSTTVNGAKLIIGAASSLPNTTLAISGGGVTQLATGIGATNVQSLSITGSSALDIENNHLFINYGTGSDPIASVAALVKSGYAAGAWTGSGIMSSAAQANSGSYGIGYADSADPNNPAGLAAGQIEVKYTLLGDANLDGAVNSIDFAILATNFNKAVVGSSGWDQGDFNYDGSINSIDFAALASNFNKGASQSATAALESFAAANGLLADVPEPTSIGLLAIGGLTMLRRRRRNV